MKATVLVLLAMGVVAASAQCLTNDGISMIKGFEGFRSREYKDVANIPTIGYGTLCSTGTLKCPGPVTEAAAAAELARSVSANYGPCVKAAVKAKMTDNQYSALVSFAYNTGCGSLQSVVHAAGGKLANFPAHMSLYNKASVNGRLQVVQGLVTRRAKEVALFRSTAPSPCASGSTLRSSAPTKMAKRSRVMGQTAAFPIAPQPKFSAPFGLPPSTTGKVIAEGIDTGKVRWIKDRKRSNRKMKLGGLGKGKASKAKPKGKNKGSKASKRHF